MASIRIWTLESDSDAKAVESLANNMVANLKLDDLSIQATKHSCSPTGAVNL